MDSREDLFALCIDKIGDLAIFEMVIQKEIKLKKLICSPLRDERHPSFYIFAGSNNRLYFKDFGTGESGDCFDLVSQYYGTTLIQGVRLIMSNFGLSKEAAIFEKSVKKDLFKDQKEELNAVIDCIEFNEDESDFSYFDQFGISTKTLSIFNVKCVKEVYINGSRKHISVEGFPIFSYTVKDKVRIYRPLSEKSTKWRGNLTLGCVFGYEQLKRKSSIGIITKSMKDIMVLYEMGYESVSPSSENQLIVDSVLADFFLSYSKHFILFDNDEAGIKATKAYVKKCLLLNPNFKLKEVYMDNAKDVSDSVRDIGFFKTKKEINEKIK